MAAQCSFFQVFPPEIRDMIYDYAFGTELEVSNIIWKKNWRGREMAIREDNQRALRYPHSDGPSSATHKIRPFPGNPLDAVIAIGSKQLFTEAASVWLRGATLQFNDNRALEEFIQTLNITPVTAISSIHVTWSPSNYQHGYFAPTLRLCTGLRKLQVTNDHGLPFLQDKHDFIDGLDEQDFAELQIVQDIIATKTLTSVEIVAGKHQHPQTDEELNRYKDNMRAMQDYILRQLKASEVIQHQSLSDDIRCYYDSITPSELKNIASIYAYGGLYADSVAATQHAQRRMDKLRNVEEHSTLPGTEMSQGDVIVEVRDNYYEMLDGSSTPKRHAVERKASPLRARSVSSGLRRSGVTKPLTKRKEPTKPSCCPCNARLERLERILGGLVFVGTVGLMYVLYL